MLRPVVMPDVEVIGDGENLSDVLLKRSLVHRHDGRRRERIFCWAMAFEGL